MLGIAVFDDEKIIVDYVGELIKENLDVNAKIYKYTKLEEFKGDCKKGILQKINAIYIDIKIDLLNGIEIAKKIQQENPKIKIIYMTAYSQYSEAIFKTKPTYLLLKPIKKEQIKKKLIIMLIIFIIISIFEVQYLASLQMGTLQMITKK